MPDADALTQDARAARRLLLATVRRGRRAGASLLARRNMKQMDQARRLAGDRGRYRGQRPAGGAAAARHGPVMAGCRRKRPTTPRPPGARAAVDRRSDRRHAATSSRAARTGASPWRWSRRPPIAAAVFRPGHDEFYSRFTGGGRRSMASRLRLPMIRTLQGATHHRQPQGAGRPDEPASTADRQATLPLQLRLAYVAAGRLMAPCRSASATTGTWRPANCSSSRPAAGSPAHPAKDTFTTGPSRGSKASLLQVRSATRRSCKP